MFGIRAALYGEITLKDGRIEQANFDAYQILRMNEAPAVFQRLLLALPVDHSSAGIKRNTRDGREPPLDFRPCARADDPDRQRLRFGR
jgi:hypothetical protein